ncbi:MAG: gamma-glutamyl-gamma-aminobutyrate hydrolase family protein [Solirubrobacterales bacterium]|nr:gamma-glutamyl-gamma-aminobutyrate hydrolase family protein [Solirubrobacterales bacterium]
MSTAPLRIAISSVPRPIETGYGPDHADTVVQGAIAAIAAVGGAPLVLPVTDPSLAPAQLQCVDGLVLSGGHDLAIPSPDPDADRWIDPVRDAHELALWRHASETGLPVLGICRGAQLVNHACGGETVAHLEGHDAGSAHETEMHDVTAAPGSRLAGVCGTEPFPVNTIHHQAVGTVGGGLRVTAVDRDGNVEAIELDGDDGWFLGIQWHPELMGTAAAGEGLFGALIAAARQHADS